MVQPVAEYQVLVDWKQVPELILDDFEDGTVGSWVPASGTLLEASTNKSYRGTYSMVFRRNITNTMKFDDATTPFDTGVFGSDLEPLPGLLATKTLTGLVTGEVYVVQAWCFVPFSSYPLKLTCDNFIFENQTVLFDNWTFIETSFTAVAATHNIYVYADNGPQIALDSVYMDYLTLSVAGDDVTNRTLSIDDITFQEGRDQARSLSAIAPATTEFELLNRDGVYTPNNPASILYSYPASGAGTQIRAKFEGRFYNLFNGFIDTFQLKVDNHTFTSIQLSAFDQLARMGSVNLSTELFNSIYIGEAVSVILDSVGWPAHKREIDYGASVLEWWWVEGATALEAITDLVKAEGIPAFVFVDENGNFVFRGRHHRYVRDNSVRVTAYFSTTDGISGI